MSKIYCVYSLLSLLSDGKKKNLQELSNELEISKTMVRNYFNELEKLGIYVESVKGRYGGYYLSGAYQKIPLMPFNENELLLLESLKNETNIKDINVLLAKIKKYISLEEDKNINSLKETSRKMYNDFTKAIHDERKIQIQYYVVYDDKLGSRDFTERIVIPDEIFYFENKWFVHGYCELRQDIRQFEFNRIKNYKIL